MLVLALMVTLFTGCKKGEPTDKQNDSDQVADTEDSNKDQDKGQDDKDEDSDDVEPIEEGKTNIATLPEFDIEEDKVVTVMAWWVHPKVGDPDMDLWPQEERLLKQLYDVDVEYIQVPAAEVPTKHASMVASGEPADVVNLQNWADYPYSFTRGLYEPLDDLVPLDHPVFDPARKYIDALRINGKAYWAVTLARCGSPDFFYNKTLIEEAGLEDPWELVKRNEWTWDKFYEYCKELTVDRDGDGVTDQYGAAVLWGFINSFVNTIGYPISKMEDGKIEINYRDERLMDYYEFLKKVGPFGEGVFHPLSFRQGDADQKRVEDFLNGNIGFFHYWDCGINPGHVFRPMLEKGEIGLCIFPKHPDADQQYIGVNIGGHGISKGAKHPQAAAAYITLRAASVFNSAKEAIEDAERIVANKEKELGIDLDAVYSDREYPMSKYDIYDLLYVAGVPKHTIGTISRQKYISYDYLKEFPENIVFDFGQFAGLTNYYAFAPLFYGDENGNPVTAQQIIEQIEPNTKEKIDNFEKAISGES